MGDKTLIEVILQLKDEATGKMRDFTSSLDNAKEASKAFSIGVLAVGAGMLAFGVSAVKAAGESQVAIASMSATLETMGAQGIKAKESILKMADAVTKLGFDDEDAAVSIAKLFQRTGDLTQAQNLNSLAMDLARAKHIGLTEASNAIGMVLSGNSKILKQYQIDIKDSATPLEALGELSVKVGGQAKAFANTWEGQMAIMTVATQNFREEIGKHLLPVLTNLLQNAITPFLLKSIEFASDIQNLTKWLREHETVLWAVAGAIAGGMVPWIWKMVFAMDGVIAKFVMGAVTLSPWMIGGFIIGGLVAGILWLKDNWELAMDSWDKLKEKLMSISAVNAIFNTVKTALENVWTVIKFSLWPAIQDLWTEIKTQLWPAILNLWNALQPLKPFMEAFALVVGVTLLGAFIVIINAFAGLLIIITKVLEFLTQFITYVVDKASLGITNFTTDIMNFVSGLKTAVEWIGNLITWIDKLSLKNIAGTIGSAYSNLGANLGFGGARASGGSVSGGLTYLVGEQGPELFSPGSSGSIIPNNKIGGSNVTINITGNTFTDKRSFERMIDDVVMNKLKLNVKI